MRARISRFVGPEFGRENVIRFYTDILSYLSTTFYVRVCFKLWLKLAFPAYARLYEAGAGADVGGGTSECFHLGQGLSLPLCIHCCFCDTDGTHCTCSDDDWGHNKINKHGGKNGLLVLPCNKRI